MDAFLQKTPLERALYIEQASGRTGKAQVVIEKDFWVCWMLRQLFSLPQIGAHLTFKGGTSLSKAYGLIERFSEDIDISFRREFLGFGGEKDPEKGKSNKERQRRIEALQNACVETIQSQLLPALKLQLSNESKRQPNCPSRAA